MTAINLDFDAINDLAQSSDWGMLFRLPHHSFIAIHQSLSPITARSEVKRTCLSSDDALSAMALPSVCSRLFFHPLPPWHSHNNPARLRILPKLRTIPSISGVDLRRVNPQSSGCGTAGLGATSGLPDATVQTQEPVVGQADRKGRTGKSPAPARAPVRDQKWAPVPAQPRSLATDLYTVAFVAPVEIPPSTSSVWPVT